MRKYILKRILLIIPTLIIVSLVVFALSKYVPNDQVVAVLNMRGVQSTDSGMAKDQYESIYHELGFARPNFYFGIQPHYYPRNLNAIAIGDARNLYEVLLKAGYDAKQVVAIESALQTNNRSVAAFLKSYEKLGAEAIQVLGLNQMAKQTFFYPKFVWHGLDNQYHSWVKSFFTNSFGVSITDGKKASGKVFNALKWTLSITIIDLLISILLSLYLGKLLVRHSHQLWTKFFDQALYFIYAIPIFWLATLFVVYFTTNDYGALTNIFPSVGIDVYPGKSTFFQIGMNGAKLMLPILCLTLHSLAYSVRFIKRSLLDEMNKDYVTLAYSKGVDRDSIIDKHIFKNALIPIITVFVGAAVSAFSGSLVIEVIFNIPGVGRLLFNAISNADWNVIFCIVMLIATITTVIYLLGDILYAYFNPKVRFAA